MKNIFDFRDGLIQEYGIFSRSFTKIVAEDILDEVNRQYEKDRYWPEPLIQLNPNFQRKETVQKLVEKDLLHPACSDIFKLGKRHGVDVIFVCEDDIRQFQMNKAKNKTK